jgi:hypothetical protein
MRVVASIEELRLPPGQFWYLASPYSKRRDLDAAAMEVIDISTDLEQLSVANFAPIPTLHDVARTAGIDPRDDQFWKEVLEPWLRKAHGCLVAMMDGWDRSNGVTHERRVFTAFDRPVLYLPENFARKALREEARAAFPKRRVASDRS